MSEILGLPREALDRARRSRDPRFDGKFFIAVLSTGIYCRPICPVRLISSPVRYYTTAAEAAEAGFRPCLRCRPEAAPGSPAWTGTSAVVRRALRLIQEGALDTGSVENLATRVGVGVRHLNRLLVEQVGASPVSIAQTRRLHFAKRLLDETDLSVTEIALAAGYGSVRRFNGALKAAYKKSPRELRKRRARSGESTDNITLRLSYRPPYDWDHLLLFLSSHAIPGVERVESTSYTRTVRTSTGHAVVKITACEDAHAVQMEIHGAPPADLFELSSNARRVFDLAADPAQIADAFRADYLLRPLAIQRPGLRIAGSWDSFECAVLAILSEHISAGAARTLTSRLVARTGRLIEPADDGLTRLFPSPHELAEANLAGLGLDSAQSDAIHALARAVLDDIVRFSDPAEDVTRSLIRIPGVSHWTAQYVALRAFGEPDAFPTEDLVLRRRAACGGPPLAARTLDARAEAWRPWRGYAAFHLWNSTADCATHPVSAAESVNRGSNRLGASQRMLSV